MPRFRQTPVTSTILVFIAVIFGIEWFLGAPHFRVSLDMLLADVNPEVLRSIGAITGDALASHEYWRLVAGMFLHANLTHWLLNSWALYQLGSLFEVMFGSRRFLLVYLVTGLCASIASAVHLPPDGISVGASGAVLGVLGAFIFSIRRSRWKHERWTRGLLNQLVFWGLVNITLPMAFPVIDNYAHTAGLISGLILGLVLPHKMPPEPPSARVIEVHPYDEF